MYDITEIIKIIFTLISIAFTLVIIPFIKSKTTKEQQDEINALVKIAVYAAEQLYIGSGRGDEKKQYVIEWLLERNIKFDAEKIDAMIESAVYTLKHNVIQ